ncbi:MAG TPA: HesA/MoeB/ThiF family protein [Deltaproteobacteria bacterium]|jgi:molybdopterin/thiamine biosynthesis adenylyltransferase|nr:HesA/MoeB/ThiF family protein [Deltaproteobacteria bacterium]
MRTLSETERKIYSRNMLLPEIGESGQLKLLESRVLIIGLGGLGSPALFYLAAAGVGNIGAADCDVVDLSNLQRQILHGRKDVGRNKTESAAETISRLNPDVRLETYGTISEENIAGTIASYDFVVEATDNFKSKFLVNDACVRNGKPFSHAGILGAYGQTMTVVPGQGPCLRCVFPEEPEAGTYETTSEAGVLGSVAGVIGTIQSIEAIKYLLGIGGLLTGRLLTFDALAMTFMEVKLPWNRECAACGAP